MIQQEFKGEGLWGQNSQEIHSLTSSSCHLLTQKWQMVLRSDFTATSFLPISNNVKGISKMFIVERLGKYEDTSNALTVLSLMWC